MPVDSIDNPRFQRFEVLAMHTETRELIAYKQG